MTKNQEQTGLEIAVIGMAGRFTGAGDIDSLWHNLKNGVESIPFFTKEELLGEGIAPALLENPNYVKARGILEGQEYFDAFFFNYSPREAETMDPQMRLFHECAWEALENAGWAGDSYDELIGVYAGASPNVQWGILAMRSEKAEILGFFDGIQLVLRDFLSTRIAHRFNLRGPAVTIQTACSTSLAAIHLACQGLICGDCDIALAGGVSISYLHKQGYLFQEGMISSPDGHCRAFDEKAQGTVGGSGVGIVVLKRLENAIRDRDTIHALVIGSSINNDGINKAGYTAPGIEGQAAVIKTARQMAEIEPETIGYIECHGTGTPLGDPVEIEALKLAFPAERKKFCAIGSIKTNIGHLDAAAGAAGFIKVVLALRYKLIPPSLHFNRSNPKIDFENSPFYVNTTLKEWKHDGYPLRAGVSSFGIGGTNAHVVLEEFFEGTRGFAPLPGEQPSRQYQLILLSAKTPTALENMTENLVNFLKENPGLTLADAAYTLQGGRKRFQYRRLAVCSDIKATIQVLSCTGVPMPRTVTCKAENQKAIFMFPGQGSQYVNMGLDLYRAEPLFRQEMDRCFDIAHPYMDCDLKEILYPSPTSHKSHKSHKSDMSSIDINRTEITQPLIFIFEYALARLLTGWGIEPHAMIGHSIGEYTAACLSGVFSLEDAIKLVALRGKLTGSLPGGAMLSVPLGEDELKSLLNQETALAAVNTSSACVISGPHGPITALAGQLKEKGINTGLLHTSHAFHSQMMDPVLNEFAREVGKITLKSPKIPYISNVTGKWITVEQAVDPGYWANHLRSPVRFARGIDELLNEENSIFLEVGPGKTLSTFFRQHDKKDKKKNPGPAVINTVKHANETAADDYYLASALGELWLYGKNIHWTGYYRGKKRHRIPLPTYPFERERYWDLKNTAKNRPEILWSKNVIDKKPGISQWFYVPSWKRKGLTGTKNEYPRPGPDRKNCLVFCDESKIGNQLANALQEKEGKVIIVKPGRIFVKENQQCYRLNPGENSGYHLLFKELHALNRVPGTIIHLWSAGKCTGGEESGINHFKRVQDCGFFSLVNIVQAIAKLGTAREIRIMVITRGIHDITGEEHIDPDKATVLGPVTVIPQEYPNLTCHCIDIGKKKKNLLQRLLAELDSETPDKIAAYRGRYRWVRAFEPMPLEKPGAGAPTLLRKNGVYMIIGGLGKIGLLIAEYLAKSVQARLILTGRSSFPGREDWDKGLETGPGDDHTGRRILKLRALEAAGAEVSVFSADAANQQEMQEVLARAEERYGPLNGIIHAAVVSENLLTAIHDINKDLGAGHFQAKVDGLRVLERILQGKEIDFCLLMSSLSSVLGGLGFAPYASANLFMDSFVHRHNRTGSRAWLSINWDGWRFPGTASPGSGTAIKPGKLAITPEEGIKTLPYLLSMTNTTNEISQVIVSPGDLQQRIEQWIGLKNRAPGEEPEKEKTSAYRMRSHLSAAYEAPRNPLEQKLVEIWQKFFGIEKIGIHDNFFELGGDSLKGMNVVNRYKDLLGQMVYIRAVFDAPTIAELAAFFSEHYSQPVMALTGGDTRQETLDLYPKKKIDAARLVSVRQLIPSLPPGEGNGASAAKNSPVIFILSPSRSGSTLLRVMLGGHPRLFAPPEMNLLASTTFGGAAATGDGVIRAIMQIRHCSVDEAKHMVKEFENQQLSTRKFYRLLQEWLEGKILVDKSPLYAFNPAVLQQAEDVFANPYYIHLLRHPYGMIRSKEEAKLNLIRGVFKDLTLSRYERAELEWIICHQNIREFFNHVPAHRQYRLKFEDLVKNPRAAMEGVCQFLGLEFDPEMLQPYKDKKQRMTDGIYPGGVMTGDPKFHEHHTIDPDVADKWKTYFKKDFLSDITWQMAESFGYEQPPKNKPRYLPINVTEKKEYYALASAQKRLYILHQLEPGSSVYNLPRVAVLEEEFDRVRLEDLFRQLIHRHENLRTSFEMKDEEPVQRVHHQVEFEIEDYDMKTRSPQPAAVLISSFVRPFDLIKPPLFRIGLAKTRDGKTLLLIDKHHIISDITTHQLLMEDFREISNGNRLKSLRLQYKDYSQWQNSPEQQEMMKQQQAYWLNLFSGEIPVLHLPIDYSRPVIQSFEGSEINFILKEPETRGLKNLAQKSSATLFMTVLSIFCILLAKLSQQEDIIVGTAAAGRRHSDLERIIGIFVNTLAIHTCPREDKTFEFFLKEVKERTLKAFENQEYPFEDLVDKISVRRDTSRNPIFDVMFSLLNPGEHSNNSWVENQESLHEHVFTKKTAKFDLSLRAFDYRKMLLFNLEYSTRLFKKETIRRIIGYFKKMVDFIILNPGKKISGIEILSGQEKKEILADFYQDLGKPLETACIQARLAMSFQKYPGHIAIENGENQHSYSQLQGGSVSISRWLSRQGVQRGSFIGIFTENRIRILAAIIGILEAGCVFVPLDTALPLQRLERMIRQTNISIVLTDAPGKEKLFAVVEQNTKAIDVNEIYRENKPLKNKARNHHPTSRGGEEPAYIYFTSGTTGKPLAIIGKNSSLLQFIRWEIDTLGLEADCRVSQFTTVGFDAFLRDIFIPLSTGGRSCVPASRDIIIGREELPAWLDKQRVSLIHCVPTVFRILNTPGLINGQLKTLKYVLLSGEPVHPHELKNWFDTFANRVRLVNLCGTTETTMAKTVYFIQPPDVHRTIIPIGKAITGAKILVLDQQMKGCGIGIAGEIYIRTPYRTLGYCNEPELTAEKFITNPLTGDPHDRLHRTGDLGRRMPDGNIELLGRIDQQVKIRGVRVELVEVESSILKHPTIKEVVVVKRRDTQGDEFLCAYITTKKGFKTSLIRDYLSREFTGYMIPSYFITLEKIPLTPNGKIDRDALPEPEIKGNEKEYIAPADEGEEKLAALWSDVLAAKKENLSAGANFFQLGGNSLKATALIFKIQKAFGVKVPLAEIFRTPTIRELAGYIKEARRVTLLPIEPAEKKEYYVLSSPQKRLYILNQVAPGSTGYNMPFFLELTGELHSRRLEDTFRKLIDRHESLRTSFHVRGETLEPVQKISPGAEIEFKIEEYTGKAVGITGKLRDFVRPFALSQPPLLRVGLIQDGNHGDKLILMVDMHHIITDGLSQRVLRQEFMSLYDNKALPGLRLQYKDFSEWCGTDTQKTTIKKQEEYWCKELAGDIPILDLPTCSARPPMQHFEGRRIPFFLSDQESEALKKFAYRQNMTLFMVILAIFNVFLYKMSGQTDIVVGIPIIGRKHEDLARIIGMFVNTLALRNFPVPGKSFTQFLKEIKNKTLKAFENQDLQFENLLEKLAVKRDTSRNPIFAVMFQFDPFEISNSEIPGLTLKRYPYEREISKFDLTLFCRESGETVFFTIEYSTKLFAENTIDWFIRYFKEIISAASSEPDKKLSEMIRIPGERKKEILEQWNEQSGNERESSNRKGNILQEKLNKGVSTFKNHIAIEFGDQALTYGEQEQRSGAVANWLINKGIGTETFIGLLIDDHMEFILAMVGVLKARCVFVPLDTSHPQNRLERMIQSTGIGLIMGDEISIKKFSAAGGPGKPFLKPPEFVCIDDLLPKGQPPVDMDMNKNTPGLRYHPEDKVYIYFTSGTTGTPKAIVGKNRSLVHFIDWEIDCFGPDETFRFSQFTTTGFDAFLRDVFSPLCSGGTVCIPGSKDILPDSDKLIQWIDKSRIGLIHCVPGLFRLFNTNRLTDENFKHLKFILFSGERINPLDLVDWYSIFNERIRLVNLYGTTETTMAKTYYFIRPADVNRERIPVGKPLPGARIIILDETMNLCDVLVTGKIYIRTPFRTFGYADAPGLTAEKFIQNPFNPRRGDKIHVTGDLGRLLPEGNIDFLGRDDSQVKIRGIRVELEEIRRVLLGHDAVKEAVVIKREIAAENEILCAYITENRQNEKDEPVRPIQIKEFLEAQLPGYMVPSHLIKIERIPLKPNGKVDYDALPHPLARNKPAGVPPGSAIEKKLHQYWTEILKIDKIGITDSFFELGGHSLTIMTLIAKIHKEFNTRIPLGEIFTNATIRKQAKLIAAGEIAKYAALEPVEEKEYYVLSSAQKRIYILHRMAPGSTTYNMPVVGVLEGDIDKVKLKETFVKLIARHAIFRTSLVVVKGEPVQVVHDDVKFELVFYQTGSRQEAGGNKQELRPGAILESFIRPFDLSLAPLLRVGLIKQEEKKYLLVVDMHHIISDGTSQGIFKQEFITLQAREQLPRLRLQYKDFSEWYSTRSQKAAIKKQEEYWIRELAGELPVLNLPTDFTRPPVQRFEGARFLFSMDETKSAALKELASGEGVTLFMIILAIFYLFLSKISGQTDMIVGTPVAGRRHENLGDMIGMFVNTLALRSVTPGEKTFNVLLQEIKTRALHAFENQDYPFEDLIEKLAVTRDVSRSPVFDVMFVFQNMEKGPAVFKPYKFEHNVAKFDLTLQGIEARGKLVFTFAYGIKLFKEETIRRFSGYFTRIFASVLQRPRQKISEYEIISAEEKDRILYDFNDTAVEYPKDKTLHRLFAEQAEKTPDNIAAAGALSIKSRASGAPGSYISTISYRELNGRANRLARLLIERGVKPDTLVGIMMRRSIARMVGIFAILKAGGAYLPLDPDYPPERIRFMLQDSGAEITLNDNDFTPEAFNNRPQGTSSHLQPAPATSQAPAASLAYIIYTSGSTGQPKGTMIEHPAVINRLTWMQKQYPLSETDVILHKTAFSFDVSVWEIFWWALAGARAYLLLAGGEKNPQVILNTIEKEKITVMHFVPSMLSLFLQYLERDHNRTARKLTTLKQVFTSGEALTLPMAERFNDKLYKSNRTRLANLYGPTEATVDVSYFDCSAEKPLERIPIGKPIDNIKLHILDLRFHLQPIGLVGELCISGVGLARGYLNNPELTARKFQVPGKSLHYRSYRSYKSYILYKTGDLARWLSDGNIEFLGRLDHQLKIRGFRIEPGEIEHRLLTHPAIKAAVVTTRDNPGPGQWDLCAYIVTERGLEIPALRDYLSQKLPDYMVPGLFITLERFPLTANGKIDRKALPKPGAAAHPSGPPPVAPSTEMEETIAQIWKEVLHLEQVGVHDNFFALGGNSLALINLNNKLASVFERDIPVIEMFKYVTIKEFVRYLSDENPGEDVRPPVPRRAERLKQAKNLYKHTFKRPEDLSNE